MRARPCGEDGLLLEVASTTEALAVHAALAGVPGVRETVPAARTVLVVLDGALEVEVEVIVARAEAAARGAGPVAAHGPLVELGVDYGGADLADTAAELGLTPAELVRQHSASDHVVAFCGFSPGFAYLTGLPPHLHVPRLATPRTVVPAGSVAIAGGFTGVYPRESPGGWRLLGRTDAAIWDAARTPPALLAPGTRVRFLPR